MFTRFAVYYTPCGALAEFGAEWLGWDIARGAPWPQSDVFGPDIAAATETPRRYGLHATIKPPFFLADGSGAGNLADAAAALCDDLAPVPLPDLHLVRMGRFLALVPVEQPAALTGLAARVVRDLDGFRAPMGTAEFVRRDKPNLSPAQRSNLRDWGYPYVMDQFRFHITLTGALDRRASARVQGLLNDALASVLPVPFILDSLTLVGEDSAGYFHEIHRMPLTGPL